MSAVGEKAIVAFNSGELSPLVDSRMDMDKISSGCRVLENMIVEAQGEARRRAGTRFVAVVSNTFDSGT